MEPLFFKAENHLHLPRCQLRYQRFNGAAFFQSGKYRRQSRNSTPPPELQWSRFFSKRKMLLPAENEDFSVLQWSRFFSKRKIETLMNLQKIEHISSMEPLFFKAENVFHSRPSRPGVDLQWSRFFSKRKMARRKVAQFAFQYSSMEPLFFKAENAQAGQ